MNTVPSDLTLRRAELLGPRGQQWFECLNDIVGTTLEEFDLTFIETLPGGSESYLALTQGADGTDCVVKVLMPNDQGMTAELAGLQAAQGRGYAKLIGANPEQRVLVIEKLGITKGGYKVISNSGINGGQEVPHFHVHILGGQKVNLSI